MKIDGVSPQQNIKKAKDLVIYLVIFILKDILRVFREKYLKWGQCGKKKVLMPATSLEKVCNSKDREKKSQSIIVNWQQVSKKNWYKNAYESLW